MNGITWRQLAAVAALVALVGGGVTSVLGIKAALASGIAENAQEVRVLDERTKAQERALEGINAHLSGISAALTAISRDLGVLRAGQEHLREEVKRLAERDGGG